MPYRDPAAKKANRVWRMERNRAIVADVKAEPCVDCGIRLPPPCMDLDHVRGEFRFWIGDGAIDCSVAHLQKELEKCDLRCPNCHRIRHYEADGRWGAARAA